MKRYFGILSLLVVFALWLGVGSRRACPCDMSDAVVSLQSDAEGNPRDRLFDITPEPQKHEATLNGVSDTFHSVNVRGRRTVPSTGFSPRSMAAHVAATNNLAVLFMAKVWQSRLSALPRISLSVRYYVIALRHILR